MINLRTYQQKLISDIRAKMSNGSKRNVLQLATGGGKTVIFSFMVKQASDRGLKCLILTDRIELLEQAGGTFQKLGIVYENITAGTNRIPVSRVMVAMVETIKRRVKKRLDFAVLLKSINLLIIDECHKQSFDEVFQYISEDCYVIGATATPYRTNAKKPMSDYFTGLVTGPSISKLIESCYLANPEYYGVNIDLSSVRMKAGEFDENDMTKLYGERKVFEGLKHNLELHAKGLKTMIFCPSVASSLNVASELGCLHVDGTMSAAARDNVLKTFENTPGAVLTNCGITTTGYDCPSIECIVLYRATTSLPLYLQMIGRGSRVTDTKHTFKILDFGMNVERFDFWHVDRIWSLEAQKKKSRKKDSFPVKFCPKCGAILAVNTKSCQYCGFIWPVIEKEKVFAELQKLDYREVQRRMVTASVEEMEALRTAKGYKVGYLLHKFDKYEQFEQYEKLKGYRRGWAKINAERFGVKKDANIYNI